MYDFSTNEFPDEKDSKVKQIRESEYKLLSSSPLNRGTEIYKSSKQSSKDIK
jgi:hypothetical protein